SEQRLLGRVGRQMVEHRADTRFLAVVDLVADVNGRGGRVADQEHRQPGLAAGCGERMSARGALLAYRARQGGTVNELCGHQPVRKGEAEDKLASRRGFEPLYLP